MRCHLCGQKMKCSASRATDGVHRYRVYRCLDPLCKTGAKSPYLETVEVPYWEAQRIRSGKLALIIGRRKHAYQMKKLHTQGKLISRRAIRAA